MKLRTITSVLLSVALVAPALSMAQGHDDHDRGRDNGHGRAGPPHAMAHDDHHDDHHDDRGAGPDHNFRRGGRLPADFRSRQYVVDDWRGHHLSAPPRGYHWVQTGADYVLVAVATGIIAQVLLNQ